MSQAQISVIRTLANIRADIELSYKPAVDSFIFHPPLSRADRRLQTEQFITVVDKKALGPCERIKENVFPYLTEKERSQVEKVRWESVEEATACVKRLEQALKLWEVQGPSEQSAEADTQMVRSEELNVQGRDRPIQQDGVEQHKALINSSLNSFPRSRTTTAPTSPANIKVRRTKMLGPTQSRMLDYSTKDVNHAAKPPAPTAKFEAIQSSHEIRHARPEVSNIQTIQIKPLQELSSKHPNQIARKQVGDGRTACEPAADRTLEGRSFASKVQPPPQPVDGYAHQRVALPVVGSNSTVAQQPKNRICSSAQPQDFYSKIAEPPLPVNTDHPNDWLELTDSQVLNSNGAWEFEARSRGR